MSFRLSSLTIFAAAALAAGALIAPAAHAIVSDSTSEIDTDTTGLAMQGYDAVAYFTDGQPKKGSAQFKIEHDGATYYFVSAAHLQMFKDNPAAYLPQYGGFCAMGTALSHKLEGDPNVWRIVDQKLYLNVNPDVAERWKKDIPGNIVKANDNWPEIKDKTPKSLE
jgi:YHS domain-containing protein